MKRRISDDRGMSLVEATIILLVLATLSAVLAPTIGNFVNDARRVKAREDVEAIGVAVVQMLKDVGAPFPLINPAETLADRHKMANRVELLFSAGNTPGTSAGAAEIPAAPTSGPLAPRNWGNIIATHVELLEDHISLNIADYVIAVPTPTTGQIGWRGPYITKLANGDPWGFRYAVNSLYLGWATDASLAGLGWNQDAMVISAGPNGVIETSFAHASGDLSGDDIGLILTGASR